MLARLGLNRNLGLLTGSMGLWGLGFGLYGTLWPLYVERLGGGPVAIGWLAAAASLITALVVLPGGVMADRGDRKKLIVWGWALAVPAPFLFAWAPHWQWLFLGVVLYFGSSFATPAVQAMIRLESRDRLAITYNVVMAAFALGAVLGPAISGYLLSMTSYQTLFVVAGILYGLSTVLILPMRLASGKGSEALSKLRDWQPRRRPRLYRWMGLSAALAMVGGLAGPYVVPFLRSVGHFDVQAIGLMGSLSTLVAAVMSPFWGRVAERTGLPRALGYGLCFSIVGLTGLWAIPRSWPAQAVGAVFRGLGGASGGLMGVAVGRVVPGVEAGTAYGLLNWVSELAGAAGPYPGALLYQFRPEAPLVFGSAVWALLVAWIFTREATPDPPI